MPGRMLRSSFRLWVLAAIVVLAQFAPTRSADAQSEHKQVLVLYSTRRDAQFSIVGESELSRVARCRPRRGTSTTTPSSSTSRGSLNPSTRKGSVDFLRLKYQGVRFDLVIAMQDLALEFLNEHGDTLFRDTPVSVPDEQPR